MKQTITLHDVEIPHEFEPTGEYRAPDAGEYYLRANGQATDAHFDFEKDKHIILRRVKQYREPVLPADGGKQVEFSHDNNHWITGKLIGWTDDEHPWEEHSSYYRYCRIEDTSCTK